MKFNPIEIARNLGTWDFFECSVENDDITELEKYAHACYKAGRDAQRESDSRLCDETADESSPLKIIAKSFADLIAKNTGDL